MTGSHPKYEALNGITENLDNSIFLLSIFGDPRERYQMEVLMRSPSTELDTRSISTESNLNQRRSINECLNIRSPPYTDSEERWLDDRMVAYDVIMKGVSFGEKAIEEFARFTLDEPLSRGFLPNSVLIFKVRALCNSSYSSTNERGTDFLSSTICRSGSTA